MPDDLSPEEIAKVVQLAVRLRLEQGLERNLAVVEAERRVIEQRGEERKAGQR